KWSALGSAFSAKFADNEIVVLEDLPVTGSKTKELISLLKVLGLDNVLIILHENNREVKLAARNVPNVDVAVVGGLNVYEILVHRKLLMTQKAVERMKEVYLG
ncbi:MAG TPA: 50S ribosomal protein L4, partial [Nitrospirae bacterium]|nr:50S ribosomal protein L4 [Nitrospirota bacterium]